MSNPQELAETTIRKLLSDIAPEVEMNSVSSDSDLREELEIDSMDVLHFAVALCDAFHIEIPEKDYPKLATIASTARYVAEAPQQKG